MIVLLQAPPPARRVWGLARPFRVGGGQVLSVDEGSSLLVQASQMSEQLLSVTGVAAYLGVKDSWVYDNWRREGIPFLRIGNHLRARRADLDKWLDGQRAR